MACQAKCANKCRAGCCCRCCSYVTSMSQARMPRLFCEGGRLTKKVLPLPESCVELGAVLNFGRYAAESCNQLAAFLQSLSHSLSLSLASAAFCGRTFWPVGGCPFLPFLAIYPGQPGTGELSFMQSFAHSLIHSLIASFIHSLSILITLWPVSCHKLQQLQQH